MMDSVPALLINEFLIRKATCRPSAGGCMVQYGLACRFSKVWQRNPCNLWPWKPQNSEKPMEFEGSEARIVKNL